MWNVIGLLLILMRTIMEAVYYWHPLYLHIISTGSCRLIFCVLLVQSVSPAKADEFTLKKNILSTFAWSSGVPREGSRLSILLGGINNPVPGVSIFKIFELGKFTFFQRTLNSSLSSHFALFEVVMVEERERLASIWFTLICSFLFFVFGIGLS